MGALAHAAPVHASVRHLHPARCRLRRARVSVPSGEAWGLPDCRAHDIPRRHQRRPPSAARAGSGAGVCSSQASASARASRLPEARRAATRSGALLRALQIRERRPLQDEAPTQELLRGGQLDDRQKGRPLPRLPLASPGKGDEDHGSTHAPSQLSRTIRQALARARVGGGASHEPPSPPRQALHDASGRPRHRRAPASES